MLMVKLTKETHHFNKTTNVICKTVAGSTSGVIMAVEQCGGEGLEL